VPNKAGKIGEWANQLIKGDCLQVLPELPSGSIDMVLCDLPYGTTQNRWDSLIPLAPLWQQYRRLLKPRGVVVLTAQGLFTARVILSNETWFRYKVAWIKSKPTNFLNAKRQPLRQHEDICVFYRQAPAYHPVMSQNTELSKDKAYDKGQRKDQYTGSYGDFKPVYVRSDGSRYPTDAVYCVTAESEGRVWHPTQKPVALGRYFIRTYTSPGAVVLDNAFGSGSFLVAAVLEGRRFVGIEKNEEVHLFKKKRIDYMKVAATRLAEAESVFRAGRQPTLFDHIYPGIRNGYRDVITHVGHAIHGD